MGWPNVYHSTRGSKVLRRGSAKAKAAGKALTEGPRVMPYGFGAAMWAFHQTKSALLWPPTTVGYPWPGHPVP
jgi:hypothetical protein